MKNWKTTLAGLLAAVGTYLVNSQVGWANVIGQVCQLAGVVLIGGLAKDHSVTGV